MMEDIKLPGQPEEQSASGPTCGNCKYVIHSPAIGLQSEHFYCRRFPPHPFLTRVDRDKETGTIISQEQLSIAPLVNKGSWCGEHAVLPEKLN